MVVWLEEFGPLKIREVTLRLDGEIEITDRAALLELNQFLLADIREALLVPYDDMWYVGGYIEDIENLDKMFVFRVID